MNFLLGENYGKNVSDVGEDTELHNYLSTPSSPPTSVDVLEWWEHNKEVFSCIARLVKEYSNSGAFSVI